MSPNVLFILYLGPLFPQHNWENHSFHNKYRNKSKIYDATVILLKFMNMYIVVQI